MKKLLLICLLVSFAFAQTAIAPTGSGTEGDPYVISNLGNLYWMTQSTDRWDDHYIQTTDIDASETSTWDDGDGGDPEGWPIVGYFISGFMPGESNIDERYSGNYNGQGHVISGLYIDRSDESPIGFISHMGNATFSGLGLENMNVSGYTQVGGFVGINDGLEITNCYTSGTVNSVSEDVGGFVGYNEGEGCLISQCYSSCQIITSGQYSGGFVGYNVSGGQICNSYATGNVTSTNQNVGGFVGKNVSNALKIENCYSTGHASGSSNVCGFCADNDGTITNCYWDIEKSENASSDGGIGINTATMKLESTFTNAGWDFTTIWDMDAGVNDGYAFLLDMPSEMALPITLSFFNVEAVNGKVELNWRTATETENSYFAIYRDGEIIAQVVGAGTTTEPHNYSFTDDKVLPSVHEYAIADVTYGGVEVLHEAISVAVSASLAEANFVMNKAYPNPFNPRTAISMHYAVGSDAVVNIYNTQGVLVDQLINDFIVAGDHEITWDASGMPSGVYLVTMQAENTVQSQKIVLMK